MTSSGEERNDKLDLTVFVGVLVSHDLICADEGQGRLGHQVQQAHLNFLPGLVDAGSR